MPLPSIAIFLRFCADLASGAKDLGVERQWEVVRVSAERLNLEEAIRVIEDYHPLDVECAAVALCLLEGIRARYPALKYLLAEYEKDPAGAAKLIAVGETKPDAKLKATELAAWTMLANQLLNLDEVLNK